VRVRTYTVYAHNYRVHRLPLYRIANARFRDVDRWDLRQTLQDLAPANFSSCQVDTTSANSVYALPKLQRTSVGSLPRGSHSVPLKKNEIRSLRITLQNVITDSLCLRGHLQVHMNDTAVLLHLHLVTEPKTPRTVYARADGVSIVRTHVHTAEQQRK